MSLYFVDGIAGNNGNSGTTPSQAKASWSAAEALALVTGDSVIGRGPCSYREAVTTSHNGAAGNPISYIGDEFGQYFPTGGEVRITGSDNDISLTRANCIISANNWRTFRGLHFDGCTGNALSLSGTNQVVEYCDFKEMGANALPIAFSGASQASGIVRECLFLYTRNLAISFSHSATLDNTGHLVENCTFLGAAFNGAVQVIRIGGITVRGCSFYGILSGGVRVSTASPAAGQTITVQGNVFTSCNTALFGLTLGDITEDYNILFGNSTDRNTVNVGAHSVSIMPGQAAPLLTLGMSPLFSGLLAPYTQIANQAGASLPANDQFNIARTIAQTWGAVQYVAGQRPYDAGQPRGGAE